MSARAEDGGVWEFDLYGVRVRISESDAQVAANLAEDFAHFEARGRTDAADIHVRLHLCAPPYGQVPPRAATVYTPRNVSFHEGGRTYIDYSGRALGIFDSASGVLDAWSLSADLLYEVGYLFLLAQLGEHFDRRGLHRVHALCVRYEQKGALVLLPMGGGKSTLATHLLREPGVSMLSDDSPLLARDGRLHAFPLRIGILPGSEGDYPAGHLRTVQRMEFGPKLLVRYELFRERIADDATPDFIFLGRRSLSLECTMEPCSRWRALLALIPNCVIGLGLFQGMEFVFNRGPEELFSKLRIAFSRLRNCVRLVQRATPVVIVLGRDTTRNAAALLEFIQANRRDKAS